MEIIINDFSLDSQFLNTEEFLDSLNDITLPMLDRLQGLQIKVLSSHNSYGLLVTEEKTLYDMMTIKGSAEIRKFKRRLQELLFDDPFWNDDIKSINEIYDCEFTELKSQHCLAEALEREIPVLSFEHNKFKDSTIKISKNSEEKVIKNLFSEGIMLEIFREDKVITHLEFIILKYNINESFGLLKGKNYFKDLVEESVLSIDDQSYIISDMDKLINFFIKGENPGDLSKTIDGKLKEFRTSLTNNRKIRFFYFESNNKIVFMNGFLKKTQKAPKSQIDRAKRIMNDY